MTIRQRNYIITLGLVLTLFLSLLFIFHIIKIINESPYRPLISFIQDSSPSGAVAIFPVFSQVFYSITSGFLLHFFFRKTKSIEIFFFILFIFSLSFDSLKTYLIFHELAQKPVYLGIFVTRVIITMKLFGVFCLLASSLFPFSTKIQRAEIVIGISLLAAITLASLIPIDGSTLSSWLVYSVGNKEIFIAFCLSLEIITIASYFLLSYKSNNNEFRLMALSLILVITGRELLFYSFGLIFSLAGFFLLSFGTVVFAKRTHSVYLWL